MSEIWFGRLPDDEDAHVRGYEPVWIDECSDMSELDWVMLMDHYRREEDASDAAFLRSMKVRPL